MHTNLLRLPLLAIPLLFVYLTFASRDFFYLALALISSIIFFLILFPHTLTKKEFTRPTIKLRLYKLKIPRFSISLFIITQIIFLYLAIYQLPSVPNNNIVLSFYLSWIHLIKNYWIFASITIISSATFVWFLAKKSYATVFFTVIISSALSFLSAYLLAIVMANVALTSKIIIGQNNILAQLRKNDKLPNIIGVDKNVKRTLVIINLQNSYKSEFLKTRLTPAIPDKLFLKKVPSEALIMSGDNLLITELDKNEIEAISPVIGRLIVKRYLATRYVKDEPQVKILSRQEYLKYRDNQINDQLKKAGEILKELARSISQTEKNIKNIDQKVTESKSQLQSALDRNALENEIVNLAQKLQENRNNLIHEQSRKAQLETSKKILENANVQKDYSNYELGLFEGEKSIKVVLESTKNTDVANFLAVLVHEYFHYTSHVSNERRFDYSLFEEGLTEYFAQKAIKDYLGAETHLAYPAYVKIIEVIAQKIPEEELKKVYFNKSNNALISLLDNSFGRNFYQESQFLFETMSYASRNDSLRVTNNILFRIGGPQLEEKNLIF